MATNIKRKVLICNDDGIDADGIITIISTLYNTNKYDIRVAAPSEGQSAKSHSMTPRGTLNANLYNYKDNLSSIIAYSITGSPADCIRIALNNNLFNDWKPELIISGINKGLNTGLCIYYSGTVAAAREGNICGYPAISLSMANLGASEFYFNECSILAESLIDNILSYLPSQLNIYSNFVFNVNFPNISKHFGFKFTKIDKSICKDNHSIISKDYNTNGDIISIKYKANSIYIRDKSNNNTSSCLISKGFSSVTLIPLYPNNIDNIPYNEISKWNIFNT